MAVRNDLVVDWSSSPRVITIRSPSVEITIQDLHDSCRFLESQANAMDNPPLIDTAGKEDLGGGVEVGLTSTLQDALVAFEARTGPTYVQCRVNGGNLVALDSFGTTLSSPIDPTAFTQVVTTASSSATSQNQASIEYGSFEGGVWYDATSSNIGTGGLNGNAQNPLNNVPDCMAVMTLRGLPAVMYVIGDMTLSTGDDVRNIHIIGVSHINSTLTVDAAALCLDTRFSKFDITGTLDGNSEIRDCVVGDLEYFNGHLHDCFLEGLIRLRGNYQANISNCSILDVMNPPTIDMLGSTQRLMMPNYSGRVIFDNIDQATASVALGLDAGEAIINPTCTAGVIAVSGTGAVKDGSSFTCYVVNTALDGSDLNNLKYIVEAQRPHHSGFGKTYFWSPYAGDDTFDGLHPRRATKTFAQAQILAEDNGHDTVICLSDDPTGTTTTNEQITITKGYLFLRGPGRDFNIHCLSDGFSCVDIQAPGVEVSSMRISNELTNTSPAVHTSGVFPFLKDLYIEESFNAININGGSQGIVQNCRVGHNTGYAIKIEGDSDHFTLKDSHLGSNGGGGVIADFSTGHELIIVNSVIHGNTGYGVSIGANTAGVQILGDVQIFDNSLGDVLDNGPNTQDLRISVGLTVDENTQLMSLPSAVDVKNEVLFTENP